MKTHINTVNLSDGQGELPDVFYAYLRGFKRPVYAQGADAWVLANYTLCQSALTGDSLQLSTAPMPGKKLTADALALQARRVAFLCCMKDEFNLWADYVLPLANNWQLGAMALYNGLNALQRYPKQRAFLLAHPAQLRRTIDELLRYAPPIPFLAGKNHHALSLAGVTIPAGSNVLLGIASANRDPAIYPNADVLDFQRRQLLPHLTFSGLGQKTQPLVDLMYVGVKTMLETWPYLHIAR